MSTGTRRALLVIGLLVVAAIIYVAFPRGAGPLDGSPEPASATTSPSSTDRGASTTPTSPPVAVLVGAGDISACNNDRDAATADLVEGVDGIVFTLGDNAYENGSAKDYESCYGPTWGRPDIKDRTRPVVGNHEYQTRGATGYFEYFGDAAGTPGEGWYAYDAGPWRIYVLNSNCGEVGGCELGSAQEGWLRTDLVEHPQACVLAMWHHPRFSSGEHGNNEDMRDVWQTLVDAGAELVLSGHDHDYERFAAQDANGAADERGLIQLVVGTGGREARAFEEPRPNSLVRASPAFGVLRLELRPDGYAFQFLPAPGTDFTDSGSGTCR